MDKCPDSTRRQRRRGSRARPPCCSGSSARKPEGLDRVTDLLRRAVHAAPCAGHRVNSCLRSLATGHPLGDLWRAPEASGRVRWFVRSE